MLVSAGVCVCVCVRARARVCVISEQGLVDCRFSAWLCGELNRDNVASPFTLPTPQELMTENAKDSRADAQDVMHGGPGHHREWPVPIVIASRHASTRRASTRRA